MPKGKSKTLSKGGSLLYTGRNSPKSKLQSKKYWIAGHQEVSKLSKKSLLENFADGAITLNNAFQ